MTILENAKLEYETAQNAYYRAIKESVGEALGTIFENSEVENIAWGLSNEPYNDQNAGEGTYGPLVNSLADPAEDELTRDDEYELFYDSYGAKNELTSPLDSVIALVGWKDMCRAFGLDDETVVYVAHRDDSVRGFALNEHTIQSY